MDLPRVTPKMDGPRVRRVTTILPYCGTSESATIAGFCIYPQLYSVRMKQQLIALLVASIFAISSAQAADAVRWEDLSKKIGNGYGRQYTVVTKDGNTRKGIVLAVRPDGVLLNGSVPEIPKDDIAEVRVHHHLAFREASGKAMFRGSGSDEIWFLTPLVFLVFPVYAVTAPPAVAFEVIRRMLPDKVIKVAP